MQGLCSLKGPLVSPLDSTSTRVFKKKGEESSDSSSDERESDRADELCSDLNRTELNSAQEEYSADEFGTADKEKQPAQHTKEEMAQNMEYMGDFTRPVIGDTNTSIGDGESLRRLSPSPNHGSHRILRRQPRRLSLLTPTDDTSAAVLTLLSPRSDKISLSLSNKLRRTTAALLRPPPPLVLPFKSSTDSSRVAAAAYHFLLCFTVNQATLCVSRVLRILKVSEQIGYTTCIQYCLEYLEAVPWVGQEEEEKVVSLVSHLEGEGIGVKPVLKRVSPEIPTPPNATLSHILELVLKSREEKGRREELEFLIPFISFPFLFKN
ncbi:uncharacterized protein LOC130994256 [Salvia miltiorrhiza]|uniref:uncharacterized protein LOC130994256 n=1 Tax=Salvia miltiorrhiza TaxID=226208 RepID=UPI0025ABEA87|nr:uncharacterized protein LOC130994256 [Salvia miltiorrhiza]